MWRTDTGKGPPMPRLPKSNAAALLRRGLIRSSFDWIVLLREILRKSINASRNRVAPIWDWSKMVQSFSSCLLTAK
jgi:hypothetical protein